MKISTMFVFFAVFILLAGAAEAKNYITNKKDTKHAEDAGCIVKEKGKHIDVLECPEITAQAMSLQEDIPAVGLDAAVNTKIQATNLISAGYTGSGKKIVVLDTGYDYNHPELSDSYLGGKDFVNNDADPLDDHGHGSFIAGLITANGVDANAKGVAPATGIISGKVLDSTNRGTFSKIIEGIYWAVDGPDGVYGTADDFNADAISMSIGSEYPYVYPTANCDTVLPTLTDAINYAKSKGITVVAAAGNSGTLGVSLPGCVSSALTVGAVDMNDAWATYSGTGPTVDIVAPGSSLYSTWRNGGYSYMSGTSAATPVVAGAVALMKSKNPTWTPDQITTALTSTALDLGDSGYDNLYGNGRIKAYDAAYYGTVVIPDYTLTVSKSGNGTITGTGINCGSDCSETYTDGTIVNLTATPASGYTFGGWSGVCAGSGTTCTITMNANTSVTATFNVVPPTTYVLTVSKAGTGNGTITGTGINCPGDCTETYLNGTSVTLTANTQSGSVFAGWSGACAGNATTCVVSMTQARTVTATFNPAPITKYTLSVYKSGTGTVTSSPTGISCGSDCSEAYNSGTLVTLTATPASGYVFSSWSGACTGTSRTCTVTMNASKSATANFKYNCGRKKGCTVAATATEVGTSPIMAS